MRYTNVDELIDKGSCPSSYPGPSSRWGFTFENTCRSLLTIDLLSLERRDGACQVFAGQAACDKRHLSYLSPFLRGGYANRIPPYDFRYLG